jgi:hypothetical protein
LPIGYVAISIAGGANQTRPGFPVAPIGRPPFNFEPSAGKLETGGPTTANNAAPVSMNSVIPGAWRPNSNGIIHSAVPPGGVVSTPQFVQQSMSYSGSPVPSSFQSAQSSAPSGPRIQVCNLDTSPMSGLLCCSFKIRTETRWHSNG